MTVVVLFLAGGAVYGAGISALRRERYGIALALNPIAAALVSTALVLAVTR